MNKTTPNKLPRLLYHPMNLLVMAALLAVVAVFGTATEMNEELRHYRMSTVTNPQDSVVETFHEDYGWWSESSTRVVVGIWSPLVVGLVLGVIAFRIAARMIDRNREEWIAILLQPIERVPSLQSEWREIVAGLRPAGVVILGIIVLIALDVFVFPWMLSGVLAYGAASVVVYPTWQSIYSAAKERARANAVKQADLRCTGIREGAIEATRLNKFRRATHPMRATGLASLKSQTTVTREASDFEQGHCCLMRP